MTKATRDQVRALKTKTISELKAQYQEVFGEAPDPTTALSYRSGSPGGSRRWRRVG